jgi:hypothetical protein
MSKGICVFCGKQAELTDDHIPPKSIYPKKIRSSLKKMNTENSCFECNNGSKIEDELFKVFVGTVGMPMWRDLLKESKESTLEKNLKLAKEIADNTKIHNEINEAGKSIEIRRTTLTDSQRNMVFEVVNKCAMAFYYKTYGRIMKLERTASFVHPSGFYQHQLIEFEYEASKASWVSLNANTCNYTFVPLKNSDIVFIINLYGNIEFYLLLRNLNFPSNA